jgi:hypothetical protein
MTTETDIIAPQGVTVDTSQGKIIVMPIKVGQIPAFADAISTFIDEYKDKGINIEQLEEVDIDIVEAITKHGNTVLNAAAIATRQEKEIIEALDLEEFAKLVAAVFRVNIDFFVKRVLPALQAAKGLADNGLGQTPSNPSQEGQASA